ncbi:hypothetical protein [Microbacterium sp. BLY]|uniref:hypothetical protein n=1 Tax=Microbacterium sp. BLY TaxID=2823280 RepID=UPI001FF0C7E3|nr:hypothetical protein [Microbacterium sp. BLY]
MSGFEMTADARADLATRLEAALRACSGVRGVYRSGSLVSTVLRAGAAALGGRTGTEPVVSVTAGERGVVVEAAIGVDGRTPALATLRHARAAVDAVLRAQDLPRESLALTVVHVQGHQEREAGERRRP